MIAVILCAGKGTRIHPLTLTRPKPLLKVCGRTILEHNLQQLQGLTKEVVLVVGYKGEMIEEFFGERYNGINIKYVWQEQTLGTGHAVKTASHLIEDKFLLLHGDDLYDKQDIKNCLKSFPCILLKQVEDPSAFGQVKVNENSVEELVEKPEMTVSNLVNTGLYFLPKTIMDSSVQKSSRGEYEFTDYIKHFIQGQKMHYALAENWMPISNVSNLFDANEFLLKAAKKKILGAIENDCAIGDSVAIGKGSVVQRGVRVEGFVYIGENCVIGQGCFLGEYTCIEDNCRIGEEVKIRNSIIGQGTLVSHSSDIFDSIIGEHCSLGPWTATGHLQLDNMIIKSMVGRETVNPERAKFGAILGDNVKTQAGTLIYPGIKIWPGKFTKHGEIVKKDLI